MANLSWNNFAKAHPTASAFTAKVSPSLPKGVVFDKNGLALPTPYRLLTTWLKQNLCGDWTSKVHSGVVIVKVAESADERAIVNQFPPIGTPRKSPVSANTRQIRYSDADYPVLAAKLGYKL